MTVKEDKYSSFASAWATATEMRLELDKVGVDVSLTKGPDSMFRFCPSLRLLSPIQHDWPASTMSRDMSQYREVTATLLGEDSTSTNALSNPDPSISTGDCCRKAAFSYTRLLRHLLLVHADTQAELDALLAETGIRTTDKQLNIATYKQFLEWLADFIGDIKRARETALKKLKIYHGGTLPGELRSLEPSEDKPEAVSGICPACNEKTTISPRDGDAYVNNERHDTCIPFGNALYDSLNADRIIVLVYEKLGAQKDPSDPDYLTSVYAFLNHIRISARSPQKWLQIALSAVELKLSLASGAVSTGDSLPNLRVSCPACAAVAALETTGELSNQDGSPHACSTQILNPLHELRTALTNEGAPGEKKPTLTNRQLGASQLVEEDRAVLLTAMALLPKSNFQTIANRASAMKAMSRVFLADEVALLSASLKSIKTRNDLEEAAWNSRRNNRSTPVLNSTPPPR